ncbi:MAG TPA: hypothetical protein VMS02_01005 [Solirubrobacteraceae bacterium]|nr:hypothetical protein [Solirubrobacteraceae bacterium]
MVVRVLSHSIARRRALLLGVLLTLAALLGAAGAASAATYDMSGEWQYTISCTCGEGADGVFVFTQMDTATGEFSGTTEWDGGLATGTASGTVAGSDTALSLEIILPHGPPSGAELRFQTSNATLETATNEFSGSGTYSGTPFTGEIKARRTRTLEQIKKEEEETVKRAKEAKEAQEKREHEEAEAHKLKEAEEKLNREKAEAEARAKIAKEKVEREAHEKQAAEQTAAKEAEAKKAAEKAQAEKAEKEAAEKAAREKADAKLRSLTLSVKTAKLAADGTVVLDLKNPNALAVSGKLTVNGAAKGGAHSRHATILGRTSFTVSADGTTSVKVKLLHITRTELAFVHRLPVVVLVAAHADGHSTPVATYDLSLTPGGHARG